MEYSPGLPQDTKSLRSCSGDRAKMLLKCQLRIKCHSQYIQIVRLLQHSTVNGAHWRSVAVLCMLFTIISNPMHRLSRALPLLHLPGRVTSGALVAHRHSSGLLALVLLSTAEPLLLLAVSLCNDLRDPVLMVWDWWVLRSEPMLYCWPNLLFIFVYYCFLFYSLHGLLLWGWSLLIDSVLTLSQPCTVTHFNYNNKIIIKSMCKCCVYVYVKSGGELLSHESNEQ